MRRYLRLMLPVLLIMSIYYFCARLDLFGKSTYNKIKNKTFTQLLWAGMLETWWGGWSFIGPTWTLGIEFWATVIVYLTALTAHNYKGRFFFYTFIIVFFVSMQYIGCSGRGRSAWISIILMIQPRVWRKAGRQAWLRKKAPFTLLSISVFHCCSVACCHGVG